MYINFEEYLKDPLNVKPTSEMDEQRERHIRVNHEYLKSMGDELGIKHSIKTIDRVIKKNSKIIHKNEINSKSKYDYVITLFSTKLNSNFYNFKLEIK